MLSASNEDKSKIVNNWVQSVAILLAGAWGLYQFIYVEKIKPLRENPSLEIKIFMHRIGTIIPKNQTIPLPVYRATITTKNLGKRKTFVAASYFQIHGDKIIRKEADYQFIKENIEEILNESNKQISKIHKIDHSELISTGTVYNAQSWFNPGQTISVERMIYLPEEFYSQIEANVFILSGPDIHNLYAKQTVNEDFDIDWMISEDKKDWHDVKTAEGGKILADKLTLTKSNKYIPITENIPNSSH